MLPRRDRTNHDSQMQYVHQLRRWGVRKYRAELPNSPAATNNFGADNGLGTNHDENKTAFLRPEPATVIETAVQRIPEPASNESTTTQITELLDRRYSYDKLSRTEQKRLVVKARYLSNCGFYTEAFPIYEMIGKTISKSPEFLVEHYVILDEFIHSATNDFEDEAVQSTLCLYQNRPYAAKSREIRHFLNRILYLHAHGQSLHRLSTVEDISLFCNGQFVWTLISQLFKEDRCLDFLVYRNITELIECQLAFRVGISSIQSIFLSQAPGPFELVDHRMRNPCIRSCLQWCAEQFGSSQWVDWEEADEWLTKSPSVLALNPADMTAVSGILLYCFLMIRWENEDNEIRKQLLNDRMGLPVETVVRKLSMIVMDELSLNQPNDWLKYTVALQTVFVRFASETAYSLLRQPDETLAHKFLDRFSYLTFRERIPDSSSAREAIYEYITMVLPKVTKIPIAEIRQPAIAAVQLNIQSDEDVRQPQHRVASFASFASNPTLTQSLRSSDSSYGRMKALRDLIIQNKGNSLRSSSSSSLFLNLVKRLSWNSSSLTATFPEPSSSAHASSSSEQACNEVQGQLLSRYSRLPLHSVAPEDLESETSRTEWTLDRVEEERIETTQNVQYEPMELF